MGTSGQEHRRRDKGVLKSAKGLWIFLITALSGVVLLGERLSSINSLPVMSHLYVFLGIFYVEILASFLLALFWRHLLAIKNDVIASLPEALAAKSLREIVRTLTSPLFLAPLMVILLSVSVASYHGIYYLKGKRLLMSRYDSILIARADGQFEVGRLDASSRILQACADVVRSSHCSRLHAALSSRTELAELVRILAREPGIGFRVRRQLYEDALRLDRSIEAYEAETRPLRSSLNSLRRDFEQASDVVLRGAIGDAARAFERINREHPGFGRSHHLLVELERLQDEPIFGGVLVTALQSYGAEVFSTQVIGDISIRSADIVLADGSD